MIIYLAPLILVLFGSIMLVLRFTKPAFSYQWLIATSAALLTWLVALISRIGIPHSFSLPNWQAFDFMRASPVLIFDDFSWLTAIMLTTLLLASLLTAPARFSEKHDLRQDFNLISDLLITAASFGALLSGNLLALILAWTLLDIFTLLFRLKEAQRGDESQPPVLPFAIGSAGSLVIILTGITLGAAGFSLELNHLDVLSTPLLLIACALRLGILTPFIAYCEDADPADRRSLVLRISPVAATLIILVRVAQSGAPPPFERYFLVIAGLVALYAAISWLNSEDEISGLPYWVLGISALAFAASVRAQPNASFAWSMVLLLPGAFLFFYSARTRWTIPIFIISVISLSTLPYTPAWGALRLYSAPFQPITLLLLFSQVILSIGYLHHGLRETYPLNALERWLRVIYPWGLAIIPLMSFSIAWWSRSAEQPSLLASWPACVNAILVLVFFFWKRGRMFFSRKIITATADLLSLNWFFQFLKAVYGAFHRLFSVGNRWLEGNASVLWTLVILMLLISLFMQASITTGGG